MPITSITKPKSHAIFEQLAGAMGANAGTAELIDSVAGMEALADEWRTLHRLSRTATAFQNFDLLHAWAREYAVDAGGSHTLQILALRGETGDLFGILPFSRTSTMGGTVLGWMGDPIIQYGDMLLHPSAPITQAKSVMGNALSKIDASAIQLPKVRTDSTIAKVINLTKHQIGAGDETAIMGLRDAGCIDGVIANFSKSTRKGIGRRRRRLEEAEGTITHRIIEAGPDAHQCVVEAIDWKKAWLDANDMTSRLFSDDVGLATLQTLSTNPQSGMVIAQMLAGGTPVAAEVGFEKEGVWCAFIGAFNPDYEKYSVGQIQMIETMHALQERGVHSYDLLAPMSNYKRPWASETVGVSDYTIPLTVHGYLYSTIVVGQLKPALKSLAENGPSVIKKAIRWAAMARALRA